MGKNCNVRRCNIEECVDKSHCNKGPAILTWLGSVTNATLVAKGNDFLKTIIILK